MNFYKNLVLLQKLSLVIDAGHASELETEAFDALLEILNKQAKNRHASSRLANNFEPGDGHFKPVEAIVC